jgi:hypothetical protein
MHACVSCTRKQSDVTGWCHGRNRATRARVWPDHRPYRTHRWWRGAGPSRSMVLGCLLIKSWYNYPGLAFFFWENPGLAWARIGGLPAFPAGPSRARYLLTYVLTREVARMHYQLVQSKVQKLSQKIKRNYRDFNKLMRNNTPTNGESTCSITGC